MSDIQIDLVGLTKISQKAGAMSFANWLVENKHMSAVDMMLNYGEWEKTV